MIKKHHFIYICFAILFIISTSGCSGGSSNKSYSTYVKGLLDMNFKGEFDDYTKTTGSRDADAQSIYEDSMDALADSFIEYYGIKLVDTGETKGKFVGLMKEIYSKSNYEVDTAQKISGTYFVDVTVSPMDLLDITHDDIVNYINDFNSRIENGDFDNYQVDQYEQEFADGIIEILENAIPSISYKEAVTVSVSINAGDYYSMSDNDFLAISKLIITDSNNQGNNSEEAKDSSSEE